LGSCSIDERDGLTIATAETSGNDGYLCLVAVGWPGHTFLEAEVLWTVENSNVLRADGYRGHGGGLVRRKRGGRFSYEWTLKVSRDAIEFASREAHGSKRNGPCLRVTVTPRDMAICTTAPFDGNGILALLARRAHQAGASPRFDFSSNEVQVCARPELISDLRRGSRVSRNFVILILASILHGHHPCALRPPIVFARRPECLGYGRYPRYVHFNSPEVIPSIPFPLRRHRSRLRFSLGSGWSFHMSRPAVTMP
jgi:hypothetical protein